MNPYFLPLLLGQIVVWLVLTSVLAYSFYLRRYKPDQYQDWWKTIGNLEKVQSPQQIIRFSATFLIAILLVTIFLTVDSSIPLIGLIKTFLPLALFFFLLLFIWRQR